MHKTRTTAYHPQSDGLVERLNRTIEDMLSKVCQIIKGIGDIHSPVVRAKREDPLHQCKQCGRMFFKKELRTRHVRNVHGSRLRCEVPGCDYTTPKTRAFRMRAHRLTNERRPAVQDHAHYADVPVVLAGVKASAQPPPVATKETGPPTDMDLDLPTDLLDDPILDLSFLDQEYITSPDTITTHKPLPSPSVEKPV